MKNIFLAVLLTVTGCASLDTEDYVFAGLHVVDTMQTKQIAASPCMEEKWPITQAFLGDDPQSSDVYEYMFTRAVVYFVGDYLTENHGPEWLRKWWSPVFIADTGLAVTNNTAKGVGLNSYPDCY